MSPISPKLTLLVLPKLGIMNGIGWRFPDLSSVGDMILIHVKFNLFMTERSGYSDRYAPSQAC